MRRKGKRPVDPSRRAAQKRDTSAMLHATPEGFTANEFLEAKISQRLASPRTFELNTSDALRVTIARYEELKREHAKGQL
jgi:hypothetical protein